MKPVFYVGALIGICLFASCQRQQLGPQAYMNWIAEEAEELQVERQMGAFVYKLRYLPVEQQVLSYVDDLEDHKALKSELEKRTGNLTFQILIETLDKSFPVLKYGLSDAQGYRERMDYLLKEMKRDIFLIRDGDSLAPALFHFEQTYDLAPYVSCLVSFEDPKIAGDDQVLLFNDQHFGSGPIKFPFSQQKIALLPQLKLNDHEN